MIVHEHKLVFIHINRTGGVSIETAFEQPVMDHTQPFKIMKELGDKWNEYYKFSIVRNPWDRMVSVYSNRKKWNNEDSTENIEFEDWMLSLNYYKEFNQLKWITNPKSEIIVDFVGRFERLEYDFQKVCRKIGVKKALPHKNKSEHQPYQCYYTDKTKKLIEEYCAEEIEMFGYRFNKLFL